MAIEDIQKGKSIEDMFADAEQRQEKLVKLTVNAAIQLTVEELLKDSKTASFSAFKRRKLIKPGSTKETFDAALKTSDGDEITEFGSIQRAEKLIASGAIKQADDLATEKQVTTYQKKATNFSDKMDKYEEKVSKYQRQLVEKAVAEAELVSALQTSISDMREGLGGGDLSAEWRDKTQRKSVTPDLPSFPKSRNGQNLAEPKDPRVEKASEICSVDLNESGIKRKKRTQDKAGNYFGNDISGITDSTRIEVHVTSPSQGTRLAEIVKSKVDQHEDRGMRLKSSGYSDHKVKLAIDGFVSELKINDISQRSADKKDRLGYNAKRSMMGKDGGFIENSTPAKQIAIADWYNRFVESITAGNNTTAQDIFTSEPKYKKFEFKAKDDSEFASDKLEDRYNELNGMMQSLHLAAASQGGSASQDKYFGMVKEYNATRSGFSEAMIEKAEEIGQEQSLRGTFTKAIHLERAASAGKTTERGGS